LAAEAGEVGLRWAGRVIAYLAGVEARPITGAVLAVDAGRGATL
jgi:hypothetical protein